MPFLEFKDYAQVITLKQNTVSITCDLVAIKESRRHFLSIVKDLFNKV